MKFTIDRASLIAALDRLISLINTRATLPVLATVLIQAKHGVVSVTANNLDCGMLAWLDAAVDRDGAATIHARNLAAVLTGLDSDHVSLQCDDKAHWVIEGGVSRFNIQGIVEDEFPPLRKLEGKECLTLVSQGDLKRAFARTQFAASTDEYRYALNGILFEVKDNKVTLVATDGRRLAIAEFEAETPHEVGAIVPIETVRHLAELLGTGGSVSMRFSKTECAFALNNSLVSSRLIEANYPNYQQVIPKERNARVTVERLALLRAAKRMSWLTQDGTYALRAEVGADAVELKLDNPNIGSGREIILAKCDRPGQTIVFNPQLLLPALEALEDQDRIHLDLIGELEPFVIKAACPFLFVQMPMRCNPNSL